MGTSPLAISSHSSAQRHEINSTTSQTQALSSSAIDGPQHMSEPKLPQAALAQLQNDMDSNSQQPHNRIRNTLSLLYNKHFNKSAHSTWDPEKTPAPSDRRFSFSSLGAILTATALIVMLFGIIAVAVALTLDRGHAHSDGLPHHSTPIRVAIAANFPDPALMFKDGTWYAYATNNAAGVLHLHGANASANSIDFGQANVQMATSTDFIHWDIADLPDEPLPTTGAWSRHKPVRPAKARQPLSSTWAPGLVRRDDGKYVMYYAAGWGGKNPYAPNLAEGIHGHPHPHCVGAAISVSTSPAGPFEALDKPLACPVLKGGAIDPEAIRDVDGTIWVTWKVDGNNIGRGGSCGNMFKPQIPTPIMLQKMKADGVTSDGEAIQILDRIEEDGPLVEAPMIVRSKQGIYFLFFSSGCTRSPSYVVKYATADKVTGPYHRASEPLLRTGVYGLEAPGSVGILQTPDGNWNMAFHARVNNKKIGRVRAMFTTGLEFHGRNVTLVQHKSTASHSEDE